MTNGARSSRFLSLLVVLVLGLVIGWLLRASVGPGPQPAPTPTAVPEATATQIPLAPTPTPTCVPLQAPGSQNVKVGGLDACTVTPECITINAHTDRIRWTTDVKGVSLWIEFADKPFKTMAKGHYQPNRVNCTGDACTSGQIQPIKPSDANYDETSKRWYKVYKYWQVFHKENSPNSDDKVCDARVIIQW